MRICFIGDSFVAGAGDDDCLGWPGRLCAAARQAGHDLTLYNLGIRRDTSADIAARWEAEARARLPPEHDGRLVFLFGVNDCVEDTPGHPRVPPDATLDNACRILARARSWRPTLMIGPPRTGDAALDRRVGTLSARLAPLCAEIGVPFLPIWDALAGTVAWRREARSGDGIHPNREGYAELAALVGAWPAWRGWMAG